MNHGSDAHLNDRRPRARGRNLRRGGIIALIAMVLQIVVPVLHGPHGASHRHTPETLTHRVAGAAAVSVSDSDCDLCPICQSIQSATQPIVPTIGSVQVAATQPRFEFTRAPEARPSFLRVVTESGPRGPPTAC